jgi:hypothetical protein
MNNIFRSNLREPSKRCVPSHTAREVSSGHPWYARFIGLGISQVSSIPERLHTKIKVYNAAFGEKIGKPFEINSDALKAVTIGILSDIV